jgi:hypothetical protein
VAPTALLLVELLPQLTHRCLTYLHCSGSTRSNSRSPIPHILQMLLLQLDCHSPPA